MAGKQPVKTNSKDKSDDQSGLQATRTRLTRHILKLVFSHLGRDGSLDSRITEFKQELQSTKDEDQRDDLIASIITDIGNCLESREQTDSTSEASNSDLFPEFLNKLAIQHEHSEEFVQLRQRLNEIQDQQDKIGLINQTIQLLNSDSSEFKKDHTELILNLIDRLNLPKEFANELEKIKERIYRNSDREKQTDLLNALSLVINNANVKLQNEVNEIRQTIVQFVAQLGEINTLLTDNLKQQRSSFKSSKKLNNDVLKSNQHLQQKIDSSSDIEEIKQSIRSHLNIVNDNIKAHLEIEATRQHQTEREMKNMQNDLHGMQKKCASLKTKLNKARKDALHDALTGLPNRLAFDECVEKELQRFDRYQHPLTLAVLDIDHFKRVNDTYGHKAGDKVLKAMANVCQDHIREIDFLARFGGEEFVLLLPDTDLEQAVQAMDKLRKVIEECHFHYSDQTVPITISIGIASFYPEENYDQVFKRADEALYAAKAAGRNCCKSEQQLESAA